MLVIALFHLGNSSNSFPILRTCDLGASLESAISIYASLNLIAALISYPAGFLSDLRGRKKALLASFLIFAFAHLGFEPTPNIYLTAAFSAFYGLYEGLFRSVGKTFASDFVPQNLHVGGIAWYSTMVGLLQLIASVVAELLWDKIGHTAVFYYGVASAVIGSIALLLLIPERKTFLAQES